MEEIIAWLNSGKDYSQGLELLKRNTHNRQLINVLTRRKIPSKLEYELKKLSGKSRTIPVEMQAIQVEIQSPIKKRKTIFGTISNLIVTFFETYTIFSAWKK